MHLRSQARLLAWSDDGARALVATEVGGPEGGGSLDYAVLGGPTPGERFEVSSDFSNGAERKQAVGADLCRARAAGLARALAGFAGVTVHPEACAAARAGLVEV